MHLALYAAETIPAKPDEDSRVDFGLCETERFQGDAKALNGRRHNK